MTARSNKKPQKNRNTFVKRIKPFVIGLYAVVIMGIGVGLFSMLDEPVVRSPEIPATENKIDEDVLAVVAELGDEGAVTVPVSGLDQLVPERKTPSWEKNAVTLAEVTGPEVAIVIDDLGLSREATDRLERMPGPYTLAYLPYAEDLPAQTGKVRQAGHELMVHLPMEPKGVAADPGTNALLLDLPEAEFERRIKWNLQQFDGFVGINNHMGSRLTEAAGPMVRVMMHLKADGYLFLDSLTSANSVGLSAAKATGVPTVSRDIFLDNIQRVEDIWEQLAKVERIARKRGYGIAIGHPYSVTLDVLAEWRETLAAKGITLVPISQIIKEKLERDHRLALLDEELAGD
ncbi:MAG: divergent polysaccharide deacetylase family protein [Alphaproteobacteria bacterium]|nr:divergent polysaccharide deacetylase family protein [Alphaproteobacteria bacterium]